MKSYLEIKVPITFDAPWFVELRNSLKGMPVLWQRDYYHITIVFIDDTQNLTAIKAIMHKYLDNAKAITITMSDMNGVSLHPVVRRFLMHRHEQEEHSSPHTDDDQERHAVDKHLLQAMT
jgi:hypothetical protein